MAQRAVTSLPHRRGGGGASFESALAGKLLLYDDADCRRVRLNDTDFCLGFVHDVIVQCLRHADWSRYVPVNRNDPRLYVQA